jgi:hypothetical protein
MTEANIRADVSGTKEGDDDSSFDDDVFPETRVKGDSDTDSSQEHRPDKEAVKVGNLALSRDPLVNNKLPLNPMPNCPYLLLTKTTKETKKMAEQVLEITKDFKRLNMGDVARANWHINGIKIYTIKIEAKSSFPVRSDGVGVRSDGNGTDRIPRKITKTATNPTYQNG